MSDTSDAPRLGARHKALFAVLYLSEGAPIGFLWWALPTRLRDAGVPVATITALTASLALPWAFKFLWAPLLDALRGRRWGYRSWMLLCQAAMGLALLPLAVLDPAAAPTLVYALCLTHAVAAATQDVAIDALAVNTIPPAERGALNGWMQAGMLFGRSLFGGAVLALGGVFDLPLGALVLGLVVVVWGVGLLAWRSPDLREPRAGEGQGLSDAARAFGASLKGALSGRLTWLGLGFALVAGAGFEATAGVAGPLLVDRGLSQAEVGAFFFLPVVSAMTVGALAGGYLADRIGKRQAAGAFLLLLAASIAQVALDPLEGFLGSASTPLALLGFYVAVGLFTASSYALFMDLTRPDAAATQFSAFMGATNGCEVWAVAAVGLLVGELGGYGPAFLTLAAASLLGLPLLACMRDAAVPTPAAPADGWENGGARGAP